MRAGLVGPLCIALPVKGISKQAPGIRRARLQLHSPAQRADCFAAATCLASGDCELQMNRRSVRLFRRERVEYFERREGASGAAMRGAEDQPGERMARRYAQNLPCLFPGELGTLFEQSLCMGKRGVDRPQRF